MAEAWPKPAVRGQRSLTQGRFDPERRYANVRFAVSKQPRTVIPTAVNRA